MSRLNKITILFVLVSIVLMILGWNFIQSRFVGDQISRYINNTLMSEFYCEIEFSRIEFQVLPIGFNLDRPRLECEKYGIYAVLDFAGIRFSHLSLLFTRVQVDNVELKNAKISILKTLDNHSNSESTEWNFTEEFLVDKYLNLYEVLVEIYGNQFMARKFDIKNIEIEYNGKSHHVDELILVKERETFLVDFKGNDIGPNIDNQNILETLDLSVRLLPERVELNRINLSHTEDILTIGGYLSTDGKKYLKANFSGGSNVFKYLHTVGIKPDIDIDLSYFEASFILDNEHYQMHKDLRVSIFDLESPYGVADSLYVNLRMDQDNLKLRELDLTRRDGRIESIGEIHLGSLEKIKNLEFNFDLKISNFFTNDLLFAIKEELDDLKAYLNGVLTVEFTGDAVSFHFHEEFSLSHLKLYVPGPEFPVLDVGSIQLDKSRIDLYFEPLVIKFDMAIEKEGNYIPFKGQITEHEIDFIASETIVNLESLGPISDIPLAGVGKADIRINGPIDNVIFEFKLNLEEARVVGLDLGRFRGELQFDLTTEKLYFINASAKKGGASLTGEGHLYFNLNSKENISLDLNVEAFRPEDVPVVLYEIFNEIDLDIDWQNYAGILSGELKLRGGFEPQDMIIDGSFYSSDIQIYRENFSGLHFILNMSDALLSFNEVVLSKTTTDKIIGEMHLSVLEDKNLYEFQTDGILLSEIDYYKNLSLAIDGKIKGRVKGNFSEDTMSHKLEASIVETHISGLPKPRSKFVLNYDEGVLEINTDLLEKMFYLDGKIDLNKISDESNLKLEVNVKEAKDFFSLFSSHNLDNAALSGNVRLNANLVFIVDQLEKLNLNVDLPSFNLNYNQFALAKNNNHENNLVIVDGNIISWDIGLGDENSENVFISKGTGRFFEDAIILSNFDVYASILELFTEDLLDVTGRILGQSRLSGHMNSLEHQFRGLASGVGFRHPLLGGEVSNLIADLQVLNREATLTDFSAEFGGGQIHAEGSAEVKLPFPAVDFKWLVQNVSLRPTPRGTINLTGAGVFVGNYPPYRLGGDVIVNRGQILDEINQLAMGRRTSLGQYQKYIPRGQQRTHEELIMLGLAIHTERAVMVRNSLMELYFNGGLRVQGGISAPSLTGEIEISPERSKLKFRGLDFLVRNGKIRFEGEDSFTAPLVSMLGQGDIAGHRLSVEVGGRADNLSIQMTSDPPLEQDDILSLLTFGVTRTVARDLDEAERQQLTTIGIGTLLFDQLRLTEGISSNLGLRFSIGPEILEDDSSMIQGRGDAGSSRVRSSTRVKLQRQLSDKVDLSVSSTVGGSIEQKQEMNLNFQINPNFSIEGVYEVKSREENISNIPDSMGVDFKWRWSF